MQNYSTHHELRCSQQPGVQTPLNLTPNSLKILSQQCWGRSREKTRAKKKETERQKRMNHIRIIRKQDLLQKEWASPKEDTENPAEAKAIDLSVTVEVSLHSYYSWNYKINIFLIGSKQQRLFMLWRDKKLFFSAGIQRSWGKCTKHLIHWPLKSIGRLPFEVQSGFLLRICKMNFVMSRQIIDFLDYNYHVFSYQPYQLQQGKPEQSHNRYIPFLYLFSFFPELLQYRNPNVLSMPSTWWKGF